MKDMYTFDADGLAAEETYSLVQAAYASLFNRLELPWTMVDADTGLIGGSKSHEYHIKSEIGEDELLSCARCGIATNVEKQAEDEARSACGLGAECELRRHHGIEVGHAFYLGTKYSEAFRATFTDASGKVQVAEMGCYGLGVTRILAAAIEVYHDDKGIMWPNNLSPYRVVIIVLNGSFSKKTASNAARLAESGFALYDRLGATSLAGDVILDTSARSNGVKLNEAALIGYTWQVIVGSRHNPDQLEVKMHGRGEPMCMSVDELVTAATKQPCVDM